jgi:hypothetical protein
MSTPNGPYQPYQPQQPVYPPPYPQHQAPKRKRRAGRWLLGGLAVIVVAFVGLAVAGSHIKTPAKAKAAAAAKASTATVRHAVKSAGGSSPGCRSQVKTWLGGGYLTEFNSLESDMGTLGTAEQRFAGDLGDGPVPPSDVSAVQNAAASVQADAQAIESNPAPSCVPGMSGDLSRAATDYQKTAIDADNAMDQYSAGDDESAVGDVRAATTASGDGNAEMTAAGNAARRFGS